MVYKGGCLCGETTFTALGEVINPHLCSCKMCQKSSGAPTVAWVSFSLSTFTWDGKRRPASFQSSQGTKRCFCTGCGGLLAAINAGSHDICVTIASLDNPDLVVPPKTAHSHKKSAPCWWEARVLNARGG